MKCLTCRSIPCSFPASLNSTPAAQVTGQTVYGYDGSVRWRIDALYDEDELLRKIRLYETSNPQVINIAFSYEAHSNKLLAVTPSLKTGAYEGYLEPHYYMMQAAYCAGKLSTKW